MARQDAEFAFRAWSDDFVHFPAEQQLIRSDDLEKNSSGHQSNSELFSGLQTLSLFQHLIDTADHVKRLFRKIVVLAVDHFLEAANRVA